MSTLQDRGEVAGVEGGNPSRSCCSRICGSCRCSSRWRSCHPSGRAGPGWSLWRWPCPHWRRWWWPGAGCLTRCSRCWRAPGPRSAERRRAAYGAGRRPSDGSRGPVDGHGGVPGRGSAVRIQPSPSDRKRCRTVQGPPDGAVLSDFLRASGAGQAQVILICVYDRRVVSAIAGLVQHAFTNAVVLARSYDRGHAMELIRAGVDFEIREILESALLMGAEGLRRLGWDEASLAETREDVRRLDAQRLTEQVQGDIMSGSDRMLTAPAPHPLQADARPGGRRAGGNRVGPRSGPRRAPRSPTAPTTPSRSATAPPPAASGPASRPA